MNDQKEQQAQTEAERRRWLKAVRHAAAQQRYRDRLKAEGASRG